MVIDDLQLLVIEKNRDLLVSSRLVVCLRRGFHKTDNFL